MTNTADHRVNGQPSGVVTFLFTDVEGSTGLWAADPDAMSASLQLHDQILQEAFTSRGGFVFTTAGDSFAVAFSRASDAVDSAIAVQDELASAAWRGPALKVRIGIHLGEAEERGRDYFGPVVNLTARLESAGHGGQVLLTDQVRQAAAIEAVELGVHQLRDVPEPIRVCQLGNGVFPPLRIVAPSRTNLPSAPSRLIGRDRVLAEVRAAFTDHRLVTLTATGGTGKTRLAMAVAEAELTHRDGGVWFVDLSPVTDGQLVPATIAAGLGLVLAGGDTTAQVVDYLRGQNSLLVLDNCEHLVEECADFFEMLLSRPGQARVLATTREYFDVDGERVIRLPPLDVEGESSPAVQLFIERALAADSTFSPDTQDRPTIAELCRHLDGSPLAIELAAARSNVMTPVELLAGIGQRFELLRGGRRRRSKQTLEDTLDWSYDLLDDEEQRLFRACGVFVGSFDLDAVVAISGLSRSMALDLTESLIAKSLIVSERAADRARFRLLETAAAYAEQALDRLGEVQAVRDRHLDHYVGLCLPFDIGFWPSRLALKVGVDRDNIRAAVKWAGLVGRWEDAGRIVYGASDVLQNQPEDLLRLALECLGHLGDADPMDTAGLQTVVILMSIQLDDFAEVDARIEVLQTSTDRFLVAVAVQWRTFSEFQANQPEACLASCLEADELVAEMPDSIAKSQLLCVTGITAGWANGYLGNHKQVREDSRKAANAIAVAAPDTAVVAEAFATEAVAHIALGDTAAALAVADILDERGYVYFNGDEIRAIAHLEVGDLDAAIPFIRVYADDAVTGRLSRMANNAMLLLALLAEAEGDHQRAADLLMSVEKVRSPSVGLSLRLADRLGVRAAFDVTRAVAEGDLYASGRRATAALTTAMTRQGWLT